MATIQVSVPPRRSYEEDRDAQICPGPTECFPDDRMIVSPYTEFQHRLNTWSLDVPNQLMATALQSLTPAQEEFATCRYEEAFNWQDVFEALRKLCRLHGGVKWSRQRFYVVDFRSRLKEDIDKERLFALDKESHAEATASGGLLKYW